MFWSSVPAVLSDPERAELARLDGLVARRRDLEALAGLAALVARHPDHAVLVFLYAKALRRTGQRARAGEVLAHAARLLPNDPHVGLGLAWSALDAGDLPRAAALAAPAREVPALRGDALAIFAREREAAGEREAARALYLESYVARPMLDVLAACERLSLGHEHDASGRRAPWPIGILHRRWLFRVVEHELSERARARFGELPASQVLSAGCDHGATVTARWAEHARVDRLALFRALSDRGGFCDCEVAMNAAREDDDDVEVVLVAGRFVGRVPASVSALLVPGHAPPPRLGASAARDREEATTADEAFFATGSALPPQLVTDALVADLATEWSATDAKRARGELLLVAPDALGAGGVPETELVVLGAGGRIDAAPLARPVPTEIAAAMPWLPAALAALDEALPPPSPPSSGHWALGPPDAPCLLARDEGGGVLVVPSLDGERLPAPTSLALAADGRHAAWLRARRTRLELWIEDRVRGERRVLAVDRFAGRPAFDPEGRAVVVVAGEEVVSLDVASGTRRVLALGERVAVAPTGVLAVERRGSITLRARDGRPLAAAFAGRAPVFSPRGDRLAYVARPDVRPEGTGDQAYVLELASASHRRVGPGYQEACWPSFAEGGRALVMWARVARRWVPLDDGRQRLEDSERLLWVDLEQDGCRVLHATDGGSLRITAPAAHPHLSLVAFGARDAPGVGQRLALVSTEGDALPVTLVDGPVRPVDWLR